MESRSRSGRPGTKGGYSSPGDRHGVDQRRHPREIDGAADAIQVVVGQLELPQEELRELVGTTVGDLEPDGLAEVTLRQLAFQRLPEVLHLLLVEPEVGVARHAELRVADDVAAAEELVQMRVDDARQQHERVVGAGDRARQRDDPRQEARRLDRGDRGFAPERVAAGQLDDEVEALVGHLRKRMRRIEADGRQQRPHFPLEITGHPGALTRIEGIAPQQVDAGVGQSRENGLVEETILLRHQQPRLVVDGAEQRAQAGNGHSRRRQAGAQLFLEAGNADLEELVEVVADDAQETQPLEQRASRDPAPASGRGG